MEGSIPPAMRALGSARPWSVEILPRARLSSSVATMPEEFDGSVDVPTDITKTTPCQTEGVSCRLMKMTIDGSTALEVAIERDATRVIALPSPPRL